MRCVICKRGEVKPGKVQAEIKVGVLRNSAVARTHISVGRPSSNQALEKLHVHLCRYWDLASQ